LSAPMKRIPGETNAEYERRTSPTALLLAPRYVPSGSGRTVRDRLTRLISGRGTRPLSPRSPRSPRGRPLCWYFS
jgi:hypothetical protein